MENNKEILIERTKNIFFKRYNHYPDVISVSPGRVNIIGEHVDYTKGLSMPVAIDKYLCVAISKNNKNTIDVYSENLKESYTSKLDKISNLQGSVPAWLMRHPSTRERINSIKKINAKIHHR